MSKSKDAFRTISEVADWLETPAHVLRFWESKFTHVKPVKRAGGRRYYRPADMKLLGGIKKLLHDDGLTIKGAQKLLREHGVKHVAALSQPLDEDLLDEDEFIEEAAYEPDAQAEPMPEPEAKVLTFPPRTDPQETTPEVTSASAPTPQTSGVEPADVADEASQPPESNVPDAPAPVVEAEPSETPAFGGDALPAFMRRAPAPTPSEEPKFEAPQFETPSEPVVAEQDDAPTTLTINPVARFEPVDPPEELESAAEETSQVEETPQVEDDKPANPIFSHRMTQDAAPSTIEPIFETTQSDSPEAATATEPAEDQIPAPITYDVPSIAKVAPELNSYSAPVGVLSALPGARKLSPELAGALSAQLDALRDLRTRMQNH